MKRWIPLGVLLLLTQVGRELLAGLVLFAIPALLVIGFLALAYLLGHGMETTFNYLRREDGR